MERKVPKYGKHKKIGKKAETLTEKMKRSPDERHTQTHGSLIETDDHGCLSRSEESKCM